MIIKNEFPINRFRHLNNMLISNELVFDEENIYRKIQENTFKYKNKLITPKNLHTAPNKAVKDQSYGNVIK